MTQDEARNELRMRLGGFSDPVLIDAELDQILLFARRPDSAGVLVGGVGWVPTWDLTWAAVRGWETKASKSVEYLSANVGGGTVAYDQIYEHCVRQADRWRRGLASTITATEPVTPVTTG